MAATYPATNFDEAVALIEQDSNIFHDVLNGDSNTNVSLDNGTVPSIRKAIQDMAAYKAPIAWANGQTENDILQLRVFGSDYYRPLTVPVVMGVSPDSNWSIYTSADASNIDYTPEGTNPTTVSVATFLNKRVLNDVTALRAYEPVVDEEQVWIRGHTQPGKGGSGFYYDASDSTSADDGGYVFVTPGGKRWKRQKASGDVKVEEFGVFGDATDESDSLKAAMDYLAATNINDVNEIRPTLDLCELNITISASGVLGTTIDGRNFAYISCAMKNGTITSNDHISFGNGFLGKFYKFENFHVNSNGGAGTIRVTGWRTQFHQVRFRGIASFEGDQPPTSTNYGQYYNVFNMCHFVGGFVKDQRYGPFNHNTFEQCRFFRGCRVFDSGDSGYTSGTPANDFHSNSFYSCEWYIINGNGVTYNGAEYAFVVEPTFAAGGINYIYGGYNENQVLGFYGNFDIKGIHHSGIATKYAGGDIGYKLPIAGNALIDRGVPYVYPVSRTNLAVGGDFSVFGQRNGTATLIPYCSRLGTTATCVMSTINDTPFGGDQVIEVSGAGSDRVFNIHTELVNGGTADKQNYWVGFYWKEKAAGTFAFEPRLANGTAGAPGTTIDLNDDWKFSLFPTNDFFRIYLPGGTTAEFYIGPISISDGGGALLPSYQGGRKIIHTNVIPTTGTWAVGDLAYNIAPAVDGNNMVLNHWICTLAGTPGTWVPQHLSTVTPAT